MSWVRIDDRFASHPKIAKLTDREFRTWVRILCYCGGYTTRGQLPEEADAEIPGLDTRLRQKLRQLHLLDHHPATGDTVHDWADYNPKDPTAAERQARRRDSRRDIDRDAAVTEPLQDRDIDRDIHRDAAVTRPRARAQAAARGPSPNPVASSEGVRGEGLEPTPQPPLTTPGAPPPPPHPAAPARPDQPQPRRNPRTGNPDDPPPPPRPKLTPLERGRNYIRNIGMTLEPGPIFEAALTATVTDLTETDILELVDEHADHVRQEAAA